MDIAYLTNVSIRSDAAGGNIHVARVAEGLARRGHRILTNLPDEPEIYGGRIGGTGRKAVRPEAFCIRIDGWPERDTLTLYRRINRKAPCIWEVNAPVEELRTQNAPEERIARLNRRRRILARLVDAAVCVSEEMEGYARAFLGLDRTYVVPNGSDPHAFSPDRRDPSLFGDGRFKAIWCGSVEYRWQGINLVRRVAERLREVDREILLLATAEGPSTENLRCLGRIPYSEMPRYIASADVGLCLYEEVDFYPGFYFSPLKLFDYMACGLPIVGSDVGQIRRVLAESGGGILTGTDVDGVVDALRLLKRDRRLRQDMGGRGREAVIARYNWDAVASRTEEILEETARQVRRGGLLREIRRFAAAEIGARIG
jgi:glycosyltransferase involved in cell wall biosynthesis